MTGHLYLKNRNHLLGQVLAGKNQWNTMPKASLEQEII